MTIINILVGAFLIGLGFLVKSNNELIAGYNTMSEEKRKHVDIDGLSTMMRNCLIAMGGSLILLDLCLSVLKMRALMPMVMVLHLLTFSGVMIILAQKYDRNKKPWLKKYFGLILVIGIGLFVVPSLYKGSEPNTIKVSEGSIVIEGSYSMTAKMIGIEMLDSIPKVKRKVGGFSSGGIRKGTFRLADWGTCQLYLESKEGPYILVTTPNRKVIINRAAPHQTQTLFSQLSQ